MINANGITAEPAPLSYHAYLSFMAARGYQHVMNRTAFGQAVRNAERVRTHVAETPHQAGNTNQPDIGEEVRSGRAAEVRGGVTINGSIRPGRSIGLY